jgi:hypothetical protein
VFGIAATSSGPERLDLLYLNQYFQMVHWAFNPSPSWADQSSPSMTSVINQGLGGTFSTPPVAVSLPGDTPLLNAPPTHAPPPEAEPGFQARVAGPAGRSLQVPPGVHHPGPGGGTSVAGPPGPLPIATQPPAPPAPFRVDVFALDQSHAMRVLGMPNGVAELTGPSGAVGVVADFGSLGGNFISSPAAVVHGEAVLVFGIQADRAMYTCSTDRTPLGDVYGAWSSLGGIFTSAPTAVSGGLGQVDVFARDANFQLAHLTWDGTNWGPDWQNLGGTLASAPVAVSWGPDRIDVFALQSDGSVGHTWWDGQIWNQWQPLVPPDPSISLVGTPSAITWGPGYLDVFVSGNDSNLYHYAQTAGAFGAPESLSAPATLPPAGAPDAWTPSPTAIALAYNHTVTLGLANQWNDEEEPMTPVAGYRIWDGATWRGWAPLESCGLPSRYRFSVDYVTCQTARALIDDSDTATASITAGNGQMQNVSQSLGNLGGSDQAQTNLVFFEPVPVELCETAIFSYQVMNSSANEPDDINTALEKVAADLAQFALKSIESDLASAKAITSITVATSVVPVIGTILVLLGEWVLSELPGAVVSGACDGMVALEQDVLLGTEIATAIAAGGKAYSVTTEHPGTTSANGCGPTSQYQVQWSITQV